MLCVKPAAGTQADEQGWFDITREGTKAFRHKSVPDAIFPKSPQIVNCAQLPYPRYDFPLWVIRSKPRFSLSLAALRILTTSLFPSTNYPTTIKIAQFAGLAQTERRETKIIEMSDSLSHTAGGFLPPRAVQPILSPAPSYASNLSSTGSGALPHPRTNPLRAGSAKEEAARRYVEGRLLGISRRYTKKFQPVEDQDGVGGGTAVGGYTNMKQVSVDLSEVVDVLWLSGTRK